MPRTFAFHICLTLSLLWLTNAAHGQPDKAKKTDQSPPPSFTTLVQERDALQKDIETLTSQVSNLDWIRVFKQQSEDAKKRGDKIRQKELEAKIREYEPYAGLEPGQADTVNLSDLSTTKHNEITAKTKHRQEIDAEMSNRMDIEGKEQDFKKSVSLYFAIIVAMVIAGFFVIAGYDEKVRQEIFAGQAGIQFITLFSLVIAIILFGITGVLEGKELAALLGGLAGYILGRSGVTPAPAPQDGTPQDGTHQQGAR